MASQTSDWVAQRVAQPAPLPLSWRVSPVVLGDGALFQSAESLSGFLGLAEDCPTSNTFELPLDLSMEIWDQPDRAADLLASNAHGLQTVSICEVSSSTVYDLKQIAKHETIDVWFHGESRAGILFTSWREVKQQHPSLDGTETQLVPEMSQQHRVPIIIGDISGDSSSWLKTPEALRDYLSLPEAPPAIRTADTDVEMSGSCEWDDHHHTPGTPSLYENYPAQLVCFIDPSECQKIKADTIGRLVPVWFSGGVPRMAWLPEYLKRQEEQEELPGHW